MVMAVSRFLTRHFLTHYHYPQRDAAGGAVREAFASWKTGYYACLCMTFGERFLSLSFHILSLLPPPFSHLPSLFSLLNMFSITPFTPSFCVLMMDRQYPPAHWRSLCTPRPTRGHRATRSLGIY